jgi:hypothetical protein
MTAEASAPSRPIRRVRPQRNQLKAAAEEVAQEETMAASEAVGSPHLAESTDSRGLTSKERAAARAKQIREHRGDEIDEGDKFAIDQSIIPEGWDYQWKRHTVLGKDDPSYDVNLRMNGWEPVPAKRHPQMMPSGSAASAITRDGMILMERPMELTMEAKARDKRKAQLQVRAKEASLAEAPQGQFGRDNKGAPLASVSKSFEAIPIPKE